MTMKHVSSSLANTLGLAARRHCAGRVKQEGPKLYVFYIRFAGRLPEGRPCRWAVKR